MRSALEKRFAGLDGRDDHMFVGFKLAVSIRFEVRGSCAHDLGVYDLDAHGYLENSGKPMKSGRTRWVRPYSSIAKTETDR